MRERAREINGSDADHPIRFRVPLAGYEPSAQGREIPPAVFVWARTRSHAEEIVSLSTEFTPR